MESINGKELKDLCEKVARLTDINDHTGAKKIVCGRLGYYDLHAVLCEVDRLHEIAGSLSSELQSIRRVIGEKMMQNIGRDYCAGVYNDIKNAF